MVIKPNFPNLKIISQIKRHAVVKFNLSGFVISEYNGNRNILFSNYCDYQVKFFDPILNKISKLAYKAIALLQKGHSKNILKVLLINKNLKIGQNSV